MNAYYERTILDADPVELIRVVYQRAINSVTEARQHLRAGRIPERTQWITRAYAALTELQSALRPEAAPDLAARMGSLYGYMQAQLLEGNFRQHDGPLAEVHQLLTTLSEGWAGVTKSMAGTIPMGGSPEMQVDTSQRLAMSA